MRLIDADWVAERLKEWRNWIAETYGENDDYVLCLDTVLMKLDDAPTADADPVKHGHWVEQEHEDWKWSKEYRCSECGQYRLVTTPVGREWNYCPSCGAKMDEVEEDD